MSIRTNMVSEHNISNTQDNSHLFLNKNFEHTIIISQVFIQKKLKINKLKYPLDIFSQGDMIFQLFFTSKNLFNLISFLNTLDK